jgi:glycosyltransferase involved in cell wall biosynthesis
MKSVFNGGSCGYSLVVPFRTDYYNAYAGALQRANLLRNCIMWTRRPMPGVPKDKNLLNPPLGLAAYVGAQCLPAYYAEAFRFSLYPLFDRWARTKLMPGDHIISSYAHANESFKWVRQHGGKTFLDGGNSHPDNFWEVLSEEHQRWACPYPPVPRFYYERARRMMEDVDYVLSPSNFVSQSFLDRGFKQNQIIPVIYPVDLTMFSPRIDRGWRMANGSPRQLNLVADGEGSGEGSRVARASEERLPPRPFTIINTGSLSLRKGTPYLLEAFRMIRKQLSDSRLLLTNAVSDSIKPILAKYSDLPIEWAPYLPPSQLAERLRSADLFILPSLEEGLVRTALEAMACGLPVILTPNTGTAQYVQEGVNGSVVPICEADAIAQQALWWREKLGSGYAVPVDNLSAQFSLERLDNMLMSGLAKALSP